MEVTVIEDIVVRRRRGRPKKRHRADKVARRAKAKDLSLVEARDECLDTLAEPVEANRTSLQIVGDDNVGRDVDTTVANCDSEYKVFLDSLREVEDPFVLEYSEGDRETKFLGYEVDDEPHESTLTITKKRKKSRETRNAKKERTLGGSKRLRSENGGVAEVFCTPRIDPHTRKSKGDVRRGWKISVSKRNVELNATSYVSCREKNQDMEDYIHYLTYMMDAERNSSSIPQNVQSLQCEERPESSCDSDIIAVDDRPFSDGDNNPFVASKNENVVDVDEENGGIGCKSWFRKELMATLRKPYTEKELYKLSRVASIQKPQTRVRELRDGRDITYKVDILGKSYLHLYPDFRSLLLRRFGSTRFKHLIRLSIKDRHRALNLLRGFFFYIKNVVHEDAFRPWVDAECSKIMPSMLEEVKPLRALTYGRCGLSE